MAVQPPLRVSRDDESAPLLAQEVDARLSRKDGYFVDQRKVDLSAALVAVMSMTSVVIFTWVLILSGNKNGSLGLFAYHPMLQTLAVTCFAFGIIQLQPTSLEDPAAKKQARNRHQYVMLLLGLPLITVGVTFMYKFKASHNSPHLTSWHGKFGFVTYCLLLLQAAVGASSIWFGGALFGGGDMAKRVYKYHRMSGYLILTLLLVTVHLGGAWSSFMVAKTGKFARVLIYTVLPALTLCAVVARIRFGKMKFW